MKTDIVLKVDKGDYTDISVLNDLFKMYDVPVVLVREEIDGNSLGAGLSPEFLLAIATLADFITVLTPMLKALSMYIGFKTNKGDKVRLIVKNGDKSMEITDETGKLLNRESIVSLAEKVLQV